MLQYKQNTKFHSNFIRKPYIVYISVYVCFIEFMYSILENAMTSGRKYVVIIQVY